MDHHVRRDITEGLRRRGVDCLTADEDHAAAASDEKLLERSSSLGRIFFTNDSDLLVIAADWLRRGRAFAGLVFARQLNITVGTAINDLELIALASDPTEWLSRIEYLPL